MTAQDGISPVIERDLFNENAYRKEKGGLSCCLSSLPNR